MYARLTGSIFGDFVSGEIFPGHTQLFLVGHHVSLPTFVEEVNGPASVAYYHFDSMYVAIKIKLNAARTIKMNLSEHDIPVLLIEIVTCTNKEEPILILL